MARKGPTTIKLHAVALSVHLKYKRFFLFLREMNVTDFLCNVQMLSNTFIYLL